RSSDLLILELVYDTSLFQSVISTEEPDFELRYKDHLTAFGVEITELYSSESMARIRNIPGYVSSMISGKYKHKDDMSALPAKEFTVIKEGNTHHKKIKGLIQEKVGIEDYRKKIKECIESKNRRFDSYIENLSHVNLVIFDFEDY